MCRRKRWWGCNGRDGEEGQEKEKNSKKPLRDSGMVFLFGNGIREWQRISQKEFTIRGAGVPWPEHMLRAVTMCANAARTGASQVPASRRTSSSITRNI
nr:MAG TPA: hypothetical protein [Caudoviricetes sp.]